MLSEDNELDLTTAQNLLRTLKELREAVYQEGQTYFSEMRPSIQRRIFILSGLNLGYYLALRKRDLRSIQTALIPWGLSSLGRTESRVLPNLDAVIATLGAICQADPASLTPRPHLRTFLRGERLLQHELNRILGKQQTERRIRIMVTMPSEAASDYNFVRELLKRGMDCMRINCAHDDATMWAAMIKHLRKAETELGRSCTILMDLAGPKVRTTNVQKPKSQKLFFNDDLILLTEQPKSSKKYPIQVGCTLPQVFKQLEVGTRVFIDDGKLGTVVEEIVPEGFVLKVVQADPKGSKLKDEKGMNFPDLELDITPLTDKDKRDLDFVAHNADIIGYSFVQKASDITLLQAELEQRLASDWRKMAIVAKIETPRAVSNLPELIVAAASQQPFAVMIARGDLAVEIGYQRMAEIQEQILWLCEAAYVPVIWATQVLENLVKNGIPTRAEMTDAAMSERAECVMLNKGPFIHKAVTILDDVLTRMEGHMSKKTPQLRELKVWQK